MGVLEVAVAWAVAAVVFGPGSACRHDQAALPLLPGTRGARWGGAVEQRAKDTARSVLAEAAADVYGSAVHKMGRKS